ncbi:hypothetical protein PPYR_13578 [Photinus pyralis]|uniref:Spaetzle domain-containing protein n=2 Tax=Photinus pyralis TaxID=7054 RepID=A0A5N4A9M8_PHOPY|nr:uncharacterized protein LOC116179253 [Photinus pyralis]KAB0793958.1 hypothetical protein PPYR_13578 [Photinus pyralis]
MNTFLKLLVLFTIYIGCSGVCAKRQRRPNLTHPMNVRIKNKFNSNGNTLRFFDHRYPIENNKENNECIHNLCYNITDYPSERVKDLIIKKEEFHHLFGSIVQPYRPPAILEKSAIDNEDVNMCAVVKYRIWPQTALNKDFKKVWIANVDNYKQDVTFEVCLPNKKCFMDSHMPSNFETFCKQQYTVIKLVSMKDDDLVLESIPIPSSCACSYRNAVAG